MNAPARPRAASGRVLQVAAAALAAGRPAAGTKGGKPRAPSSARTAAAPAATGARAARPPLDLGRSLVEAFLTSERVNQVLLELLDPAVWRTFPPCSPRRNVATTFAHIHNVRCMRLAASGDRDAVPARLDRAEVTLDAARAALTASAAATARLIAAALANGGRLRGFPPGVVVMVAVAIAHESHHRGQVCHWARELGKPLTAEGQLLLWEWDKRWKEVAGKPPPAGTP